MNRTTQILGVAALMLLNQCTPAHADHYDDEMAQAAKPKTDQTYGYVSTENINRDYEAAKMRRDLEDENYFLRQDLEQQKMIQAEGQEP